MLFTLISAFAGRLRVDSFDMREGEVGDASTLGRYDLEDALISESSQIMMERRIHGCWLAGVAEMRDWWMVIFGALRRTTEVYEYVICSVVDA